MKYVLILFLFLFSATAGFAQGRQDKKVSGNSSAEFYAKSLFRSVDGIYFDLEQDPAAAGISSYWNILDWLQGRVAGLQIYTLRNGTKVPVIRNNLATIYVDDVRYSADVLNMMPIHDIALVKVMKSPGIFMGPGGAIAIYTKRGESEEEEEG